MVKKVKQKQFRVLSNIGRVKHAVSFHDGVKKHADKSPFFDIRTFKNKKVLNTFKKSLEKKGFKEV